jgi:hypothetical protein
MLGTGMLGTGMLGTGMLGTGHAILECHRKQLTMHCLSPVSPRLLFHLRLTVTSQVEMTGRRGIERILGLRKC